MKTEVNEKDDLTDNRVVSLLEFFFVFFFSNTSRKRPLIGVFFFLIAPAKCELTTSDTFFERNSSGVVWTIVYIRSLLTFNCRSHNFFCHQEMRKFVVTLFRFFLFFLFFQFSWKRGGGGGGGGGRETLILRKYMKGLKFNPDVSACVVYF